MRDMMSIILEDALDQEMDEELVYSKNDYRNKELNNCWNAHFWKAIHTNYGAIKVNIPRNQKGEFEPSIVKNVRIQPPRA